MAGGSWLVAAGSSVRFFLGLGTVTDSVSGTAKGGAHSRKRSQAVAGGRKRLRCPFLARNPLLRVPCSSTAACDPSTHIFSCALCHESSFHQNFILTEKNGFVPESNNCTGK